MLVPATSRYAVAEPPNEPLNDRYILATGDRFISATSCWPTSAKIGGDTVELSVRSVQFGINGHFWTAHVENVAAGVDVTINLTPTANSILERIMGHRWSDHWRGEVMKRWAEQYVADKGVPAAPISIGTAASAEIRITDVTVQTTLRSWGILT